MTRLEDDLRPAFERASEEAGARLEKLRAGLPDPRSPIRAGPSSIRAEILVTRRDDGGYSVFMHDDETPSEFMVHAVAWQGITAENPEDAIKIFRDVGPSMVASGIHRLFVDLIEAGASADSLREAVGLAVAFTVLDT